MVERYVPYYNLTGSPLIRPTRAIKPTLPCDFRYVYRAESREAALSCLLLKATLLEGSNTLFLSRVQCLYFCNRGNFNQTQPPPTSAKRSKLFIQTYFCLEWAALPPTEAASTTYLWERSVRCRRLMPCMV